MKNSIRKKFLDYDARPEPKTDRFCVKCQRDIKGGNYRWVRLVDGGMILHPADEKQYVPDGGDLGWHRVGTDCAKQIGLEWSVPNRNGSPGVVDSKQGASRVLS